MAKNLDSMLCETEEYKAKKHKEAKRPEVKQPETVKLKK